MFDVLAGTPLHDYVLGGAPWVLSWGAQARIRGPAALVDKVRADVAGMPGRYGVAPDER